MAERLEEEINNKHYSGSLCRVTGYSCPAKRLILLWQPSGNTGIKNSNLVFTSVPNSLGQNHFENNLKLGRLLRDVDLWYTLVVLAAVALDGSVPPSKPTAGSAAKLSSFVSSITRHTEQSSGFSNLFGVVALGATAFALSQVYFHFDKILPKTLRPNKRKRERRGVKPERLSVGQRPEPNAERKRPHRRQSSRMTRRRTTSNGRGLLESAARKEI